MRRCGLFESDADMQRRLEVLRRINMMVKKWVKEVSVDKVKIIEFTKNNPLIYRCHQINWIMSEANYLHLDHIDLECTHLGRILTHYALFLDILTDRIFSHLFMKSWKRFLINFDLEAINFLRTRILPICTKLRMRLCQSSNCIIMASNWTFFLHV